MLSNFLMTTFNGLEGRNRLSKEEGLKILTPKQVLQRLPIPFAKVQADNTSEKLLNEVRHNIFFASKKKYTKNIYN